MTNPDPSSINILGQLAAAASRQGATSVEHWNPPYCGDIGLAILADGSWTYRGSPIRREAMVRLFARVLRRDLDGRHYLVTPAEKVDIAVADAPFRAVEMAVTGSGRSQQLTFRTNVDDVVECGPERPLRFVVEAASGGLKPYVLVRGRLEALASRALVYDIVELAEPVQGGDPDRLGVWSRGAWFRLPDG